MIKDELIELFLDVTKDMITHDSALLRRVVNMRNRINNRELFLLGETKDEFTTTLAADYLGVSRPTLMKYIRDGKLTAHLVGRHHRVKKADLEEFRAKRVEEQHQAIAELHRLEEEYNG